MYDDRTIILKCMRQTVLRTLHSAELLFGRPLRDFLPSKVDRLTGDLWKKVAKAREEALVPRAYTASTNWSKTTKNLPPLAVGDYVMIQNQTGNHPRRWDRRGRVVRVLGYDQYQVMVSGSRRVTLRNRRYLRKFKAFHPIPFDSLPLDQEHGPSGGQGVEDQEQQEGNRRQIEHTGGELVPQPVTVSQVPGAEGHDAPLGTQDEVQNVPAPPDPVVGEDQPAGTPLRRSGRSTKGKTSRFKDFVP